MSALRFFVRPGDMSNVDWFGFGDFFSPRFPQDDAATEVSTPTNIVLRDEVTGSRISMYGQFDLSSEEGRLASFVTRTVVRAPGEPLMEWSGFQLGLTDLLRGDFGALSSALLGGPDTITGGTGSDRILGGPGDDQLLGGQGQDSLEGGDGADSLSGEDGGDRLSGNGGPDTLDGGAGDDRLEGDANDDSLRGSGGRDTLEGGDGNDTLDGGWDDDTLLGGAGADSMFGGLEVGDAEPGNDEMHGGGDNDTLDGGEGRDRIDGGEGDDVVEGGGGDDTLAGGDGADRVTAGSGADRVDAGLGNDSGDGGAGSDTLEGRDGADSLRGGQGADLLDGGEGPDLLDGGPGADTLLGGPGDDILIGGPQTWILDRISPGDRLSISADGRFAAFEWTSQRTIGNDTRPTTDAYVANLESGTTVPVSRLPEDESVFRDTGYDPSISGDGGVIAFVRYVAETAGGRWDSGYQVVARYLGTGEFVLVSSSADGEAGEASSRTPAISADGRWVAFVSDSANLVDGDANGLADVFLKDLQTGAVELVSRSIESLADGESSVPSVSADGRYVGFVSSATNLVSDARETTVAYYVKDRLTGEVTLVAERGLDDPHWAPALSGDGRHVAWVQYAVGNGGETTGGVIVTDLGTGASIPASQDARGYPGAAAGLSLSHEGRYVAFHSVSATLGDPEPDGRFDVFVRDLVTGTLEIVTEPAEVTGVMLDALEPVMSADGGTVLLRAPDAERYWVAAARRGATGGDGIDGGAGLDSACYAGKRASFELAPAAEEEVRVARSGSPSDTVDRLTAVERVCFDDYAVAFDVTPTGNVADPVTKGDGGNGGKAYRLYQAAFDRTPDLAGLGYWIAQVDAGARLFDLATGFIGSAEFKALYGENPTNQQYTRALYLNVLDREPDEPGYAYWNAVLEGEPWNGVDVGRTTRQQMLVDFSESLENQANVIGVIGGGFDYLPWG